MKENKKGGGRNSLCSHFAMSHNVRLGLSDRNFFTEELIVNPRGFTETDNHDDFIPIGEVADLESFDNLYNAYAKITNAELKDYVENCIEPEEDALREYEKRGLNSKTNKSSDILSKFISALDLGNLQYCKSYDVNKVVKAIEVASSFKKTWMREISIMILKEAIKMLIFVHNNNFNLNEKMPQFFQTIEMSSFLSYFKSMNGEENVCKEDIQKLLYKVYAPFAIMSGKKYYPKNIGKIMKMYS